MKDFDEYDDEEILVECEVCEEDIVVDQYLDVGDTVYCEECGAEFVIKSCDPLILKRTDEDEEYDEEGDWPDE